MGRYSLKSLDAAASTGPGTALMFDSPRAFHFGSVQVFVTGSPTSQNVNVEATLDGVHWNMIGGTSAVEVSSFGVPPVLGLRANLTSLVGGVSPTVSAVIAVAPFE